MVLIILMIRHGGNTFFVSPGTYSYTVTPADVTKAIVSGTVTVTATSGASAMISVVNGKKIEIYVIDETPDQNTIEGASVILTELLKLLMQPAMWFSNAKR
ncbi:MAG: hypothetical protein U0Z17_00910 [Bacteroidales bacterium]